MVNKKESFVLARSAARAAEQALALGYAPAGARTGLAALLSLDATLGGIVRSTSQPIVGQMRLTWWHDALVTLDSAVPPAEPILRGLHETVLPRGVSGAGLATMIDGWEVLLDDEPPADAGMTVFARHRGATLFAAMTTLCGCDDARVGALGEGWALADLAANLSDPAAASVARQLARDRVSAGLVGVLPVRLRGLGAMALLARADLDARSRPGSPGRVARLLTHRLTGR